MAFIAVALVSLELAWAGPADMSRSVVTGVGQKTATLLEFALSGTRNTQWATMPVRYVDSSGRLVATGGLKKADGATAYGCLDIEGKLQPEGVEYERSNRRFKYRCNNGSEEVVACIGSSRTNNSRIEVGRDVEINGFWHKCQSFPNGTVMYTEESICSIGSRDYEPGDVIQVSFLLLQCHHQGYKAIGCYFLNEDKKPISMSPGEKKVVGKTVHCCEEKDGTLRYFSKASGCVKSGKEFNEGDTFKANHLDYKCTNGLADITGCYIDDRRQLAIGEDLVENHMVYRCYRLGGGVTYTEYACGLNATPSCTPEPIPQEPAGLYTRNGIVDRGFNAFSIIQAGNDSVLSRLGTLNLELNKSMMSQQ